ncbi:MAG: fluoride efflux transporter CrcB [Bacteroidota bacterium]|nr:fluoride efflux transporter CrcB [Bacteroidota bacterium]
MKLILVVGLGGFIGSILRYLVSHFFHQRASTSFPVGTFIVNLVGCFLIGLLFASFLKYKPSQEWQLFLITGLLGGFTTFSAFSQESFSMMNKGEYGMALSYILLSVFGGILLTSAGYFVGR